MLAAGAHLRDEPGTAPSGNLPDSLRRRNWSLKKNEFPKSSLRFREGTCPLTGQTPLTSGTLSGQWGPGAGCV